jgi:Cro/C1-type HTH DNA-binding domain
MVGPLASPRIGAEQGREVLHGGVLAGEPEHRMDGVGVRCLSATKDQWVQLPRETLTALCDALEVEPGELFTFKRKAG